MAAGPGRALVPASSSERRPHYAHPHTPNQEPVATPARSPQGDATLLPAASIPPLLATRTGTPAADTRTHGRRHLIRSPGRWLRPFARTPESETQLPACA